MQTWVSTPRYIMNLYFSHDYGRREWSILTSLQYVKPAGCNNRGKLRSENEIMIIFKSFHIIPVHIHIPVFSCESLVYNS